MRSWLPNCNCGLLAAAVAGLAIAWQTNMGGIQEKTQSALAMIQQGWQVAGAIINGIVNAIAERMGMLGQAATQADR